jgi:hypothetical protein
MSNHVRSLEGRHRPMPPFQGSKTTQYDLSPPGRCPGLSYAAPSGLKRKRKR